MQDIRKLLDIVNESSSGGTSAGSVAPMAQSFHTEQRRVDEEKPEAPEVIEYGMWENSALTTSSKLKKSRGKSSKVVKSIYGQDAPSGDKSDKKKDVAEGRFVKGPGGVPSDRYGNPKEPKPPKGLGAVTLKQLEKNKKENPGQSPFKTQDDKVKKYLGLGEQGVTEMDNRTSSGDRREQRNNSPEAIAQREKEQQKRLKSISPEMRKKLRLPEPKEGVAEGSGPQKGDPVYYGSRLVGWFLGYSKYGKVITKPNYDEMGDEYANRDVYWDKDAVTIKSDKQGVAEGYVSKNIRYKDHPTDKNSVILTQIPQGAKTRLKVGDVMSRVTLKKLAGFSKERSVAEGSLSGLEVYMDPKDGKVKKYPAKQGAAEDRLSQIQSQAMALSRKANAVGVGKEWAHMLKTGSTEEINAALDLAWDKVDGAAMTGLMTSLQEVVNYLSGESDYLPSKITEQGVAENYPKHQDLSGISTEKLKAYLAKQSQQSVSGEGNQVKRVQAELQRREQGVAEGLVKDIKRLATGKDVKSRVGQEIDKAIQATTSGDHKTAHKHFKRFDKLDKLANKDKSVAGGTEELEESDLILNPASISKAVRGLVPPSSGHSDHEIEMAKSDLYQAGKNAVRVYELIKDMSEEEGLEGWVQEKITKAADYLNTIAEYLEGKQLESMDGVGPSTKMFTSESEMEEGKTGPGLWANIHAKRERIKKGSGERMRKPGSEGAPTASNFKSAQAGTKK
jgi:hypothetical protein